MEQLGVAVVIGEAVAPLGEQAAEFSGGIAHHLEAADDGVGVAKLEFGPERVEVTDAAIAAETEDGLVLRAFAAAAVLTTGPNFCDAGATDRAGVAALVA